MSKLQSILTTGIFVLLIGGGLLLNIIIPSPDVLESERRRPAPFPPLSVDTVRSSEFMHSFGDFATDHFVFRDTFRTIRAVTVFDIFQQTDKSGIYRDPLIGAGSFNQVNERSTERVADRLNRLAEFFPELDLYYSFIPDKSIYAGRFFPGFDPDVTRRILTERLPDMTFIDLTPALAAGDFYRTDLHWDQAELKAVLSTLGSAMGFSDRPDRDFSVHTAGEFQGVYAGQIALPQPPDTMYYLTNYVIESAKVSYFDPQQGEWVDGPMYDVDAVHGRDPYDLFLKGVQPLIRIENPAADTDRQLYMFRDSFGSSLAPLLTPAYAVITLIDMRYIDSRVLEHFITFSQENADVLFLYSSQVLNNADILLIN